MSGRFYDEGADGVKNITQIYGPGHEVDLTFGLEGGLERKL
jgi:hypothetical protein